MQTSSKKMNPAKQKQIFEQFFTLFEDLQTPAEITQFCSDFFTETELSVFAKRLAIAYSLHQGMSYKDIKRELRVSSATISSVAEFIEKTGFKLAIDKIKEDQLLDQKLSKIYKIFKAN